MMPSKRILSSWAVETFCQQTCEWLSC